MWNRFKNLLKRVETVEQTLYKEINEIKEIHKVCVACGITGHKSDMYCSSSFFVDGRLWISGDLKYYHNGCYAEKFNKHLCPCGCGKWIDNKKNSK